MKKLICILLIVVGGCTKQNMNHIMLSWEGCTINEVVAQWGYPSEVRPYQDHYLYIWNENGPMLYSFWDYGMVGNRLYCQRIFEVNQDNYIVRMSWEGTNCPSFSKAWAKK